MRVTVRSAAEAAEARCGWPAAAAARTAAATAAPPPAACPLPAPAAAVVLNTGTYDQAGDHALVLVPLALNAMVTPGDGQPFLQFGAGGGHVCVRPQRTLTSTCARMSTPSFAYSACSYQQRLQAG